MGLEPITFRLEVGRAIHCAKGAIIVLSAGFEPAHPKITELKSVALDHSANMSWFVFQNAIELRCSTDWANSVNTVQDLNLQPPA